ncbi:MAG: HlyD family efflux transporter periplasmic adaptor subunit [Solirubrobacteraceae bacterium]|nr:HlyD family efflux transporter periplasmic adaptor subunit [Solirubrobacteraceae bacterium]
MTHRRPSALTILIGAVALAIVVAAGLAIGSPETSTAVERTVTVKKGVVQSTVSGTGNLEPAQQVDLDFSTSGEITYVAVTSGDHVDEGDVLAKVDDAAAKVAVAQAQAELESAQDQASTATTATATTTTATTTTTSTTAVATAYAATVTTPAPTTTTPQAEAQTETTPQTTTPPKATTTPPETTTTPSAPSSESSSSGSSGMSAAAAEAAVDSAQLALDQANDELEATVLRAPISATVTDVTKSEGETTGGGSSSSSSGSADADGSSPSAGGDDSSSSSSSSSSFITLSQLSRLRMEVSLSESDIDDVKVGQAATVTVNAKDGQQFAAKVTEVGQMSSSSTSSDAVSYPVTLTLDKTSATLRAGMSASAEIITDETSGVVVPNQALQGSTVTVERNGERSTQRVQVGVAGDTTTEITSGLKAGDVVVVTSQAAAAGAAAGQSGGATAPNAQQMRGGAGGLGGGGFSGGPPSGGGFSGPPAGGGRP